MKTFACVGPTKQFNDDLAVFPFVPVFVNENIIGPNVHADARRSKLGLERKQYEGVGDKSCPQGTLAL